MEAAHLGAACADVDDKVLAAALCQLAEAPSLPRLINIVDDDGRIIGPDAEPLKARNWLAAGVRARRLLPAELAPSLAIPTWLYGQEPEMPFATAYAKYFHNSIREEALVMQSKCGIVYAQGGGGTIRENFQDLEENFHATEPEHFTPMIFFDPDSYWERDAQPESPGIDVDDVLRRIFIRAHGAQASAFLSKVVFTTDVDRILMILQSQREVGQDNLRLIMAGQAGVFTFASWNR